MMFMERLIRETERLSVICSMLDTMRNSDSNPDAIGWTSPIGMLKITGACASILELASSIALAGYRECQKDILDEIAFETRHVLYSIAARAEA